MSRSRTENLRIRTARVNNRRHIRVLFFSWDWSDPDLAFRLQSRGNSGEAIDETPSISTAGKTFQEVAAEIREALPWVTEVEIENTFSPQEGTTLDLLIYGPNHLQNDSIETARRYEAGSQGPAGFVSATHHENYIKVSVPEHVTLTAEAIAGKFYIKPELPDGIEPTPSFGGFNEPRIQNDPWTPPNARLDKAETDEIYRPTEFIVPPGSDVIFSVAVERDTKWILTQVFRPSVSGANDIGDFDGTSSSSHSGG